MFFTLHVSLIERRKRETVCAPSSPHTQHEIIVKTTCCQGWETAGGNTHMLALKQPREVF